ncbi:MAG: beta-ketoacyl-[acyl-carrier-protein] synthase family protein [Myxococcales bacterium]|nr:beta-ketoacyl-[acyl-carrier-protein] synthase family protein [Myxococcales bacterium]
MGINTPIGDNLETFFESLMAGKSALRNWICVDPAGIYSKVGGDMSDYDWKVKQTALKAKLPEDVFKRMRKLIKKAPFSTRLSVLTTADAFVDAKLLGGGFDPERIAICVGGHNLNKHYQHENYVQFTEEPDYVDSLAALMALDTDHAGSISEVFQCKGPIYTMGGACASANIAMRNALDEIRYHDYDVAVVAGAALEYAPMDLHAMALMGAISFQSFNDAPEKASRPYDRDREGFIPSHGSATLVLESLEHAKARGAHIHAEVVHVTAQSDGCHLPSPSVDGQSRTMSRLLKQAGVSPDEIDYVSAHATSTPLGDKTELDSIKTVFGDHARKLKINAPKSMLGHTCWSAPAVETVAAVLQMNRGWLHPSINIDNLDPEVDLDVCANEPVQHEVRTFVKNSFGFGGINCCSLIRRWEG